MFYPGFPFALAGRSNARIIAKTKQIADKSFGAVGVRVSLRFVRAPVQTFKSGAMKTSDPAIIVAKV
jgi:hypothetical protein